MSLIVLGGPLCAEFIVTAEGRNNYGISTDFSGFFSY